MRFLDLIKSNLEADDLDGGLAFRRSAAEGDRPALYTTLAGLKVRDGKAFDRWFRDAVEQLKPEKKGFEATLDVARAADGTAIHQIVGPFGKDDDDDEADADDDDDDDEDDEDVVRIFGKAKLAVAFRGDAIVAAFGEHAVGSVREAVEGLSTPAAGRVRGGRARHAGGAAVRIRRLPRRRGGAQDVQAGGGRGVPREGREEGPVLDVAQG